MSHRDADVCDLAVAVCVPVGLKCALSKLFDRLAFDAAAFHSP